MVAVPGATPVMVPSLLTLATLEREDVQETFASEGVRVTLGLAVCPGSKLIEDLAMEKLSSSSSSFLPLW